MSRNAMNALTAMNDAMQAAERLERQGFAVNEDGNRGVNEVGLSTLADLCTVLMVQTQSGPTFAERTAGATSRAMLGAIADLYAQLAGTPTDGSDTVAHLAKAVRVARTGAP